jgi:hypothetical protein
VPGWVSASRCWARWAIWAALPGPTRLSISCPSGRLGPRNHLKPGPKTGY